MDNFLMSYLVLIVIATLAFLGFWGVVIYLIIGLLQEKSNLAMKNKPGIVSKGTQTYSSHDRREILIDSEVGGITAQDGMDLNEIRL